MKEKNIDNLGRAAKRFLGTFLLSLLFFYTVNITMDFYLILFILSGLFVLIFYRNTKHQEILTGLLVLGLGNLSAFMTMHYVRNGWPHYLFMQGGETALYRKAFLLGVCGLEILAIAGKILFYGYRNKRIRHQQPVMLKSREYDIARILEYLPQVEAVGLNGVWGSGKSFLVEQLCDKAEIVSEYEIIRIDLLSCSLDKVEEIVLSGIDDILHRNGVLSGHSVKLRKALGENGLLLQMKSLIFPGEATMSAAFGNLQKDADNLKKKILIIYEDLDRVGDKEIICKIFDISNKLAGDRMKVLYLYDGDKLAELGLNRDFLEKYIPYIVNISDVPFREMAKLCYEELGLQALGVKEEDICNLEGEIYRDYQLRQLLKLNISFQYRMYGVTIRKVRVFLQEVKVMLEKNAEFQKEENREIVIAFLFMKHFHYEFYEQLSIRERMLSLLKFKGEEGEYTLPRLILERKKYEENPETGMSDEALKKLFADQTNCNLYGVLTLFTYHFDVMDLQTTQDERPGQKEENVGKRLKSIATEDNERIRKRNHNEKIDRMVWNLYANGRSEYTNMEQVTEKLYREVLKKPATEWREAERKFLQDMFQEENVWKDNETIFISGVKWQVFIFQAFRTVGASGKMWTALLEFYFAGREDAGIDYDLMDVLQYCDMQYKEVLLKVAEEFLKCQVKGNLNREKNYYIFLNEALNAIHMQGYESYYEMWMCSFSEKQIAPNEKMICSILDRVKRALERELQEHWLEAADRELELLIGFVERNRQLILQEKPVPVSRPQRGNTRMYGRMHHDYPAVYEALEEKVGQEDFDEALEQAYAAGQIRMYELKELKK